MTLYDNFEFDMSDDAWANEVVTALPAILNQEDDSNNQKLLRLLSDKSNYWKNNKLKLHDNLSYLTATGQSLTDIAAEYGINRIDNDDEFLRFEIRLKIYQRMFGATEQGTKQFIAKVFDIDVNDFNVIASDRLEEIEITNLPFIFYGDADKKLEKQRIISRNIQDNLPPTFKLKDIVYSTETNEHLYYGTVNDTSTIHNDSMNNSLVFSINTDESLFYAAYTENDYMSYEVISGNKYEVNANAYIGLDIKVTKNINITEK